jgi:hypothetical protein
MRSLYETVLYKRTSEEIKKICKDTTLSKSWSIRVNGKLDTFYLIDSITGDRKYKWDNKKSTPFRQWYSNYCPKVSHDYTVGALIGDAIRSPIFHISLAFVWITISSYINYYKLTNKVSDEDENKLAAGLVISSIILHSLLYYFMFTMARPFSYKYIHIENIVMALLLLFNPITIPIIILGLNLASVEEREMYKNYLWKINTGFSALYGILGIVMGWVALWFWI